MYLYVYSQNYPLSFLINNSAYKDLLFSDDYSWHTHLNHEQMLYDIYLKLSCYFALPSRT